METEQACQTQGKCYTRADVRCLRGGWVEARLASASTAKDILQQYQFTLSDFRSNVLQIKPRWLTIQWTLDDAVSQPLRLMVAEPYLDVEPNGDGACAMRSVFGSPSTTKQLFASDAREMASHYLGMLPEASVGNDSIALTCTHICESLWSEFAKPVLRGSSSVEARVS